MKLCLIQVYILKKIMFWNQNMNLTKLTIMSSHFQILCLFKMNKTDLGKIFSMNKNLKGHILKFPTTLTALYRVNV